MRWLVILGISIDLAAALLIASAITGRTAAENREEATSRWDANFWIVLFREREQAQVRVGVGVLALGFVVQLAGYFGSFDSWRIAAAATIAVATIAASFFVGKLVADRLVPPLRYYGREELKLPEGIEDQRHVVLLRTPEEIQTWWKLYARKMLGRALVGTDERVRARVDHGRWWADCPRCGSGMLAWPENPRVACIPKCATSFLVEYPAEREEIERILVTRPKEQDRNWRPDETLDDLRERNRADGLPV